MPLSRMVRRQKQSGHGEKVFDRGVSTNQSTALEQILPCSIFLLSWRLAFGASHENNK